MASTRAPQRWYSGNIDQRKSKYHHFSNIRLSKKPSAGVCRPQAAKKFNRFSRGVYYDFAMTPSRGHAKLNSARPLDVAAQNLGKNPLRGASVELCAKGAQPRRRAERSPFKKDAKHLQHSPHNLCICNGCVGFSTIFSLVFSLYSLIMFSINASILAALSFLIWSVT